MGGYGSGRWRTHTKQAVEDGLTLSISTMREPLRRGEPWRGSVTWSRGERRTASIGCEYRPAGTEGQLRLRYSKTRPDGDKIDSDYWLDLETTPCTFGGLRWWFLCPLINNGAACKRRCAKLHCPPGSLYFGCRVCYDLTYRSCQESHKYDGLYRMLAEGTPLTPQEIKQALERRWA